MKFKEIQKKYLQQFKKFTFFITNYIFFCIHFYCSDYFVNSIRHFGIYKNQIGHIN
jgi:purine-cytosine permease-like protein